MKSYKIVGIKDLPMLEREKIESIKRLNKLFIFAILLTPFILSIFYSAIILFLPGSIFFASNPDSGNILYGIDYLRNVPEERYEFGIVALAALQATIFIGAQNRALGKEESVRAEEANYIFNKFAYFVSFLISLIIFCILIASIGNFSFWIALVIFWISTSLISLFVDSSREIEQKMIGAKESSRKMKERLNCIAEGGDNPINIQGNLNKTSFLYKIFSWFKNIWNYLRLLSVKSFLYPHLFLLAVTLISHCFSGKDAIPAEFIVSFVSYIFLEFLTLYIILGEDSRSSSSFLEEKLFKVMFVISPLLIIMRVENDLMFLTTLIIPIFNFCALKKIQSSIEYKQILSRLIKKNIDNLDNQINLQESMLRSTQTSGLANDIHLTRRQNLMQKHYRLFKKQRTSLWLVRKLGSGEPKNSSRN